MGLYLFIKKIIFFIVFSFLLYIIGVVVYGEFVPKNFQSNIFYEKFAYGFSNTRFKEVKGIKEVDILVLGSSRAYRHYDPRNFAKKGFTSFNLGSSGQTFLQTKILVNRYLNLLNPKFVVLDIYPGMFSSDGVESSTDLISNDYNSWDTFRMAISQKNIKVINTWIFAFYREFFFNSLNDKEKFIKGKNKYILNGYVEREVTTNRAIVDLKEKWIFKELQWKSFKEIIEIIENANSELILIHSPRHSGFHYYNEDKLLHYLKSRNIPYYNYKDLNFINDSLHFYDPSHLNQNGVDLYNNFIIEKHF